MNGERGTVVGQHVLPEKLTRARRLRRTMTRAESVLWERLRGHRLAGLGFRRQQVLDGFIADFYCHAARLVVEVDGPVHETQREYDSARDDALTRRGVRVLRVMNAEVNDDLAGVLARIAAACADQP